MAKRCDVCGKGRVVGGSITHRGLPKKAGGIGLQLVKTNKRVFRPNLQNVRIRTENGSVKRAKVCTSCIRSGKIQKA